MQSIADCPSCGYPLMTSIGQRVSCPNCGEASIAERISQVTIPTNLFIGVAAFVVGVFVGPAIIASTKRGQTYLEKVARGA